MYPSLCSILKIRVLKISLIKITRFKAPEVWVSLFKKHRFIETLNLYLLQSEHPQGGKFQSSNDSANDSLYFLFQRSLFSLEF